MINFSYIKMMFITVSNLLFKLFYAFIHNWITLLVFFCKIKYV